MLIKIFLKNYINGDWGLGIGDCGLGNGPNPPTPKHKPQTPIHLKIFYTNFII